MQLAETARAAGREDVATIAELRILWFESIADPRGNARRRLIALAADTDPARRLRATGARLLLSRIYRGEGDRAAADALLVQVTRSLADGPRRRLLYAPAYDLGLREPDPGVDPSAGPIGRNTISRSTHSFEGKWINVGFWVMPDGHVSGLEILRQGRRADWAAPLLAAIRGRVHSEAPEATYRLERYTYIAPYRDNAGARRWVRSSNARAEYLDLSTGDPPDLATRNPRRLRPRRRGPGRAEAQPSAISLQRTGWVRPAIRASGPSTRSQLRILSGPLRRAE